MASVHINLGQDASHLELFQGFILEISFCLEEEKENIVYIHTHTCTTYATLLSDILGRHSGVIVRVFSSRSNCPGSSPSWENCVVFLGRHLKFTVPLSTQEYKWVPANLLLGVTL